MACQRGFFRALLVLAAGCGPNLRAIATRRAVAELACAPVALRVRGIGELRVRVPSAHAVELYEASGCEREQVYVCAAETSACVREIGELPWPEARPAFEQEHELLRAAARARCPESELHVAQESASLFRFDACDGSVAYHCRARGCEALPAPGRR